MPVGSIVGRLNANSASLGKAATVNIFNPVKVRFDRVGIGIRLEGDDVLSGNDFLLQLVVKGRSQDSRDDGSQKERDLAKSGHNGSG